MEYKRGKHVINEIQRTIDAAEALKIGDFETVGELMNERYLSIYLILYLSNSISILSN
jgi:galactokinase